MQTTLDATFTATNKPEWSKSGLEDKIMAFILETDQVRFFHAYYLYSAHFVTTVLLRHCLLLIIRLFVSC